MFLTALLQTRLVREAGEEVRDGLAGKIAAFFDYVISRVPNWIAGFIVFVLSIFIAKMAKAAVEARISDQVDEEHQEVLVLAGRVTYFGTLALGITVALKIAGIDLTTILAAVAFGIGFALRDLIMNFIAGVLILVSRQFTIGDFIKVGDTIGKVMEIQTRATILKAIDGTKVIVPNAEIFSNQVISFTTNPLRRVIVPLYISYDTDINYAMKVALEILKKNPKILKKPAPSVVIKEYGDSSIDLAARFWVGSRDGWYKIRSEVMQQMWDGFTEAGINVPYNVMHVETSQDTAAESHEAGERTKKKMSEMQLSKAIEEDKNKIAETVNGNGNGNGKAGGQVDSQAGGAKNISAATAQAAAETVPVEPEGAYLDQVEIDGQA